jgi:hypothetical protein
MAPNGRCKSDLSIRSRTVALAENNTALFTWQDLLSAESGKAAWRLVEFFGLAVRPSPFLARIEWSSGGGAGGRVDVVVPTATRVCIMARSVRVKVAHRLNAAQTVGVNIADGRESTDNVWEEWHTGAVGPASIPIPMFAQRARFEAADIAALAAAQLDFKDGLGTLRGRFTGGAQPSAGISIAGAKSLEVTCTAAARVLFDLAL